MNYLFRVDFSKKIGFGHLMRCFAIQEHINNKNNNFMYVVGNNEEKIYNNFFENKKNFFLSKNTYTFKNSKTEFNLNKDIYFTKMIAAKYNNLIVIVDNYHINRRWNFEISKVCNKLIVINDVLKKKYIL